MSERSSKTNFDTARLGILGDALGDVVVIIDTEGRIRWANRAAIDLVQEPLDWWVGRPGFELVHPDDLALAAMSLETVREKSVGTPIEIRVKAAGGWRLFELLGSHFDDSHIALVMRDLTQRRRWEIAGDDVARFRSILQNAAGLTALLARDGTVVSASAAITRLLGHDPEAIEGKPFADLVEESDRDVFELAFGEAIRRGADGGTPAVAEVDLCSSKDHPIPFELTLVSLLDDPTVEGVVVSGHDITRLRVAQDALAELAHYDALTGLLNRRSFDEALEREWMLTHRDGIDSFVIVFDLDGFKDVNDTHGHAIGDEVLRQVARAVSAVARPTDTSGRLGGDEFGVLLVRCGDEAAALGFEARLEAELRRRPWPFDARITATVGHESLKRAPSPNEALRSADLRMLAQKRKRRGGIR